MTVEALPEETILSPFLQKLSRSAPFLFMGVLIFGALAWRPTTAPIELETLASAWHMHLRGALVPLRNGVAAPEIPPLLHWLILGGWQVFGVSEWWPRLVPALASIGTVILVGRTALVLWPHRAATPIFARLLLTGVGAFAVAMTMVEPQTVALPFILASFHALSELWMSRPGFFRTIFGWVLSAAAAAAGGDGRRLELGAGAGAVRHRHLGAGRRHAAGAQCVPVAARRRRDQRAGPGAGVALARPLRQHRAADVFRQWLERPRHRGLARGGLDAVAAAGGALSLDLLEDAVACAHPPLARDGRRRVPPVPCLPGRVLRGRTRLRLAAGRPAARSFCRCRCWGRGCWRPRRSSRRISTPWCPASSRCSSASSSS